MIADSLLPLPLPRDATLLMATPPYNRVVMWRSFEADPPLGTIAVAPASDGPGLAGLALLRHACVVWPWLIPVCCMEAERSWAVEVLWPGKGRVGVFSQPFAARGSLPHVRKIVAAVDDRQWPGAAEVAEYVRERTRLADLAEAVHDQAEQVLSPGSRTPQVSAATYSRRFHQYGSYSARDWRSVVQMMIYLLAVRKKTALPLAARLARLTLERRARRYLHRSLHDCTALAGWEWVLEQHLRSGQYVGL